MVQTCTSEQTELIIKDYIVKEFVYDRPEMVLPNELDLMEEGIIDSLGLFRLITFLEQQFGFIVDPEEILLENFDTVNAIKSFVIAKGS